MSNQITIRRATAADDRAVLRLSALDDRRPARGQTLLAFVDDELAAARPFDGREPVADPFRRTSHLLEMLELQSRTERGVAA